MVGVSVICSPNASIDATVSLADQGGPVRNRLSVVVEDEAFDLIRISGKALCPFPEPINNSVRPWGHRPRPPGPGSAVTVGVARHQRPGRRPGGAGDKVHHAIVDGVSGTELLGSPCSTPTRRPSPISTGPKQPSRGRFGPVGHRPAGSRGRIVANAAGTDGAPPAHGPPAGSCRPTADDATSSRRGTHSPCGRSRRAHRESQQRRPQPRTSERRGPESIVRGPDPAQRRFAFASLPLSGIKAVKDAVPGATVNDVVVALCAGGLRRRMLARVTTSLHPW